jgi:hypothetical protein
MVAALPLAPYPVLVVAWNIAWMYRVDVTYDNYPEETRWFLKQVSTGAIIVEYGYNEVNTEGLSLSESVDLVPGEA